MIRNARSARNDQVFINRKLSPGEPVNPEPPSPFTIANAWLKLINGDTDNAASELIRNEPINVPFMRDIAVKRIISQIRTRDETAEKGLLALAAKVPDKEWLYSLLSSESHRLNDNFHWAQQVIFLFGDSEIAAALRATLGNEVAAAALLKKGEKKKNWQ